MTHGDWPALEGIHWPKNYATTEDYPDEFGEVRVVDPVQAQQARRLADDIFDVPVMSQDDGARLDTPENHRAKAIEKMTAELNKSLGAGEKAKRWGDSFGADRALISKVNQALDKLQDALEDVARFES